MNTDTTTPTDLKDLKQNPDAVSYPEKISKSFDKTKRTSKVCTMCSKTKLVQDRYLNGRCDECRAKAKKQKAFLKFEKPTPRERTRKCRGCEKTYTDNNRRNGCCSNACLRSITPQKTVNCAECGVRSRVIHQEASVVDFNTTCSNACQQKFQTKYEDELYNEWEASLTSKQIKDMKNMVNMDEVIAPLLDKSHTALHQIRLLHHESINATLIKPAYIARHNKKLNTNLRILVLGFQQRFLTSTSHTQTN